MKTQARERDSRNVWVWDAVDGEFRHPGELPTGAQATKAFFVDKIFGPRVAKISRAILLDRKGGLSGGMSIIEREDGSNHEVPISRVLPWYEGLLLLQEIEASGGSVPWFTERLRGMLDQERLKLSKSHALASSIYVERKLLQQAVTGASYIDHDDKEHHFRRDKLKTDEKIDEEEDALEGFWKIDTVLNYMPPWEAFCNQRCGLYQEFYQVRWDKFQDTDFSNVENGCSDPGSTWEPDECLPPHMDGVRLREKQAWIRRKKDQEAKEHITKAQEAAETKVGKRKENGSPQVLERPAKMGRFRRDGKPLIPDMFRLSFGHDFVPAPMDDRNDAIRMGWPRKPEEYPAGFGVADPPGFCHSKCDCMDDQRGQQTWETSKNWLEDPQRTTDVLKMIETFSAETRIVRKRGTVSKQFYLENVLPNQAEAQDIQCKAALYLAKETESQIQKALKDLPLSALLDTNQEVRIPWLAFMKPEEGYAPVRFQLSPDTSARSWAKIRPEDGVLSVTTEPPSRQAPVRIEIYHPEALGAVVDCLVTDHSGTPEWRKGTASVVACFLNVQKCQLTRNARIILQERMSKVYDFEHRVAKEDITFGDWLSCMELTLRLLRSLAFANLVKSEDYASRPPPRAAVARSY